MLKDLYKKLQEHSSKFKISALWNAYSILEPKKVTKLTTKEQRDALTNLISLVRYAFKTTRELHDFISTISRNFELWCGQKQRIQPLTDIQRKLALEIAQYIATNGALTVEEIQQDTSNIELLVQSTKAFGSTENLSNTLSTLSRFILAA